MTTTWNDPAGEIVSSLKNYTETETIYFENSNASINTHTYVLSIIYCYDT